MIHQVKPQDRQCSRRDSNTTPPELKSEKLPIESICPILFTVFSCVHKVYWILLNYNNWEIFNKLRTTEFVSRESPACGHSETARARTSNNVCSLELELESSEGFREIQLWRYASFIYCENQLSCVTPCFCGIFSDTFPYRVVYIEGWNYEQQESVWNSGVLYAWFIYFENLFHIFYAMPVRHLFDALPYRIVYIEGWNWWKT
jgi:hypothetical protein